MAAKVEKKSNAKKIAIIVCVALLALLVILTVIWVFTSYIPYNKYVDMVKSRGTESWKDTISYSSGFDTTRYQYYIARPNWLSWTGFIAISMPGEVGVDGYSISPDGVNVKIVGGKAVEYTADISITKIQAGKVSTSLHYIKVDKNGKYLPAGGNVDYTILEVYENHEANIKNLVRKINSIFGFTD